MNNQVVYALLFICNNSTSNNLIYKYIYSQFVHSFIYTPASYTAHKLRTAHKSSQGAKADSDQASASWSCARIIDNDRNLPHNVLNGLPYREGAVCKAAL